MCGTRDLGIKWPQWHTLIVEGQTRVDMRYVCSRDVKKMLSRQAQVSQLEGVGSEARVKKLAGAGSGSAAEENEGRVD